MSTKIKMFRNTPFLARPPFFSTERAQEVDAPIHFDVLQSVAKNDASNCDIHDKNHQAQIKQMVQEIDDKLHQKEMYKDNFIHIEHEDSDEWEKL